MKSVNEGKSGQFRSVENQLEQIPTNRSVEAKDQRPFRQNPGLKLQIQLKIKINTNRETGEHHQQGVATWPHLDRGNAAKAAFSQLCW